MKDREFLAVRERSDFRNWFDASGHGLDEIGLGMVLVCAQMMAARVPFAAPKFTTLFLALYLMAAGIAVWFLKRHLVKSFLYSMRGRITLLRDLHAYGVFFLITMLVAFALLRMSGTVVPEKSVDMWGSFFTMLFAFVAIHYKSVLHVAYTVLSAWLTFFWIANASASVFFTLLGGVITVAGLMHLGVFILAQRAFSRGPHE